MELVQNNKEQILQIVNEALKLYEHDIDSLIYYDDVTELYWIRNGNLAGITMNFDEAMHCLKNIKINGCKAWRLPLKKELLCLCGRGDSWLESNGFSNLQDIYWTGSGSEGGWPEEIWHPIEEDYRYRRENIWTVDIKSRQSIGLYGYGQKYKYYILPVLGIAKDEFDDIPNRMYSKAVVSEEKVENSNIGNFVILITVILYIIFIMLTD